MTSLREARKMAQALRADGLTLREIADCLNQEGHTTKKGCTFGVGTTGHLLAGGQKKSKVVKHRNVTKKRRRGGRLCAIKELIDSNMSDDTIIAMIGLILQETVDA